MVFVRRIKKKSGTYLAEVKGYRDENGKVRQKVIRYLGKEVNGKAEKRVLASQVRVKRVKRSLDVLVVHSIAQELGLTKLKNQSALALVYAQVLGKHSINQLERWMQFTEIPDVLNLKHSSTKDFYESLAEVDDKEINRINETLYKRFKKIDDSCDVAVLDVTDTYFAGSREKLKRRKGKDGKVRKLLQIGLAVSFKHGLPLFHKKYHGNLSNTDIFKDMALELEERNLRGIIVDRGMTCDENIRVAESLKLSFIGGLRKNANLVNDYISKITREELYSLKYRIALKNTTVFATSFAYGKGKLIVVYNPALEVVKKELHFVKGQTVDDAYVGYSLIYHTTKYGVAEVVRKYYDKEIVERAFKQLKGVLSLRPIRVWLENHVEGHVNICYLAYAILAYMNRKLTGLETSAVDALASLEHGYRVTLETAGVEWGVHVALEPKQKKLLKALDVVYKN